MAPQQITPGFNNKVAKGKRREFVGLPHGVCWKYLGGRVDREQGKGVHPGGGGDVDDDPLPPG